MRSPNLNIIIKAIDKISGRLARDFGEIENLQNNHISATKFANACYNRIQEELASDLLKIHPDYNIEFLDGKKIVSNSNAEYNYLICPIDGLINLSRAIPYFTTIVALEHMGADGKKEVISSVIGNVATNELYFAEKGNGAFLNSRRIRVSKRDNGDNSLCVLTSKNLFKNPLIMDSKNNFRLSGSSSLDLAYLASGRVDLVVFEKTDDAILRLTSLFLRESGGSISEKEGLILLNNGKVNL